ncbi:MAG: crosslink repair DNA glycosylase YcaQ family protein [Bacteroidota bacterium]
MSPTLLAKVRSWSLRRQGLLEHQLPLSALLEQVIGVYSAHPSGPLSLWARMPGFQYADLQELEAKKQVVRVPAMRESVHILPTQTAHRIMGATLAPGDDPGWAARYSEPGRDIPVDTYPNWDTDLLAACSEPLAVKDLKPTGVLPADKLKFALNRLGFERRILRVGAKGPRSNIISYVSTKAWLGRGWQAESPEADRSWLAEAYFRTFGPARLEDFCWWARLTKQTARAAMAPLHLVSVHEDWMMLAEDQAAFAACAPPAEWPLILLPQWDAYTMGYAPDGRDRILPQAAVKRLYGKLGATGGNALGAVLLEGSCAAVWTARLKGSTYSVTFDPLRALAPYQPLLEAKFLEMAQWLGLKKVALA